MTDIQPPRHRGIFWTAAAVAVVLLISGAVVAVIAYQSTSGPAGAVRGYFAALKRANAADALGFGNLPDGSHQLLTSTVLKEQQRIAPISQVAIIATEKRHNAATVTVQYRLGFGDGAQQAVDKVEVVKKGRNWRLARTAVATTLHLRQANNRATILGGPVPSGPVLLFPGALPISFDSPYLGLDPATSSVRLSDPADTRLTVDLTAAGRGAVTDAVTKAIRACLAGGAKTDPSCPLPSDRYVPGSLRATMSSTALSQLALSIGDDPDGTIEVSAHDVPVTGSFQRLDFNNLRVSGSGTVKLDLDARAYAVTPLAITWLGSQ